MGKANEHTMREDIERIINAVAKAAGLRPCQILCKKRFPDTIDARWIAVKLLREQGCYSSQIADAMGMTARNVNCILYNVEIRLSDDDKQLRYILEKARKYLSQMDSNL